MNWAERRSIYESNQKAGSNTGESLKKNLSGDRWAQRREQYNQYNSGTNNTAASQRTKGGDNSRMWKQRNAMRNSAYRAQEYGRLLGLDFEEQQNKINAIKTDIDAEKSNNSKLVSRYTALSRQKDPLNKNKDELFSLNKQIRASSEKIKKAEEEAERLENEYRSANLYQKQDKQREQIREHGDYKAVIDKNEDDAYYRAVNNLVRVGSKAELAENSAKGNVVSANSGNIISQMTEEERNTYNYIFETEGSEAAKDYLNILEYNTAARYKRQRTKDAQEMANSGVGGAAAGTGLSIIEGAVSDTGGALSYYGEKFLRDIGRADDSLPINYQKTFASSTWSNALQEQVTENIDNPVWQFLYSTGVSMADNAVRNIILAPLGTPGILGAMALRVAGQNINEGLSRGMTEEQAALYGAQNALGEVVGEIIPLDRLLKIKSPKTLIEAVKTIGGQAVVEGLGEGITTLWNNLVSASTAGTLSDYNMAKAAYMQQGMNEEEAEKQATKDSIHQLLLDMAGGFISGGVMGGGAMAIDRIANTAYGKKTENRMSAALTSDIDETETGKLAEKYERKGMDTEEAAQKAREDIQNKKAKEYTKQGMSKEEALSAVQAADIATAEKNKKMRGNILSRGLNSEEGSEANKAAKAIKSKLQSGEKVSAGEWQSLIKTTARTIDISETKSAIKKAAQKSGETITEANTDTMAAAMVKDFHGGYMTGSENKLIKNSKAAMTAYGELTGVDYNTGEKIKEVAARKEQAQKQSIGAKINSTLSRQAAEYSGEEKSEGYKNILSKTYKAYLSIVEHASGEDRTKVWSKFGAEDYAEMFDAFYNAGKSGEYTLESLLSGIEKEYNAQNAAKEAFSTAYELGREESKKESTKTAKTKQAELEAKIKAGKENKNANAPRGIVRSISQKELETGSAKKAGAKAVDMKRHFSQKQRAAISVMREFAKNADINVVFYETEGGKGANGWYDSETDTIYIDLFSGFDNEQAMLRTLSHELTHFIEKYAPKHHNEFKNFLFDYYYGKDGGKTLDRLIDEERRLAPEKNREYWENEVVANASERFVNDEGAMRALISEHADVAKSVDQWFSKMNYALRRAFKGVAASNEAVKELLANAEVFSEAQKRWNALLEESVKAKKAVGTAEESEGARFSKRIDSDYMKAVESGDTETAQKLVDEAAKAAGYDSEPLYHGTQNFGFTKLDVSKSDDEISFFATSNPDMAQTYSGKSGTKKINEALGDINNLTEEEVVDRLNKESVTDGYGMGSKYRIMRPADIKAFLADVDQRIEKLDDVVERKTTEYVDRLATDFNDANLRAHSKLVALSEALQFYNYDKMSTPLWTLLNNTDVFNSTEKKRYGNLEADIRLRNGLTAKKGIDEGAVIRESLDRYEIKVKTFEEAKSELATYTASGNYVLRGKTKGLLEIDGNGHNWNDIFATLEPKGGNTLRAEYNSSTSSIKLSDKNGEFADIPAKSLSEAEPAMARAITKQYGSYFAATVFAQAKDQLRNSATAEVAIKTTGKTDTRNIAQFAKEQGYRGAKITNIYDNGGRGANADTGNVYIYFYPQEDVKSADAVTYYDKGNVIPLSERFNAKNDDIRYSKRGNFVEDKYYSRQIDNLENLKEGSYITVGEIKKDSPLNLVGIPDKRLYFDVSKIRQEMKDRSDPIPSEKIKDIPKVLDNPIVITEYVDKHETHSVNVYGKLYIGSSPVVVGVMISKGRGGNIINKVQTVHPNRNFANEMTADKILYLTPNKKEARQWFQALSAQMPLLGGNKSGFIRSITQKGNEVKSSVSDLDKSQYQLRREDINRLNILEGQETRLDNKIKALEKEYKKALEEEQRRGVLAQDYARAEGFLAGQIEQGKQDAKTIGRRLEAYQSKLKQVRERRDELLESRKEAYAKYRKKRTDTFNRGRLRESVVKSIKKLNSMLINPTDNRHIPQDLRGAVAGFLGNFTDNTSVFSKSKLETLKAAYSDIAKEDSSLNDLYDPDIAEYISKMEKVVDGKRLSELSYDELFYVKTITDYFSHIVRDGNALFIDGKKQEISSIAAETVDAANKRGDKLYRGGIFGKALRFGDTYFNYKNTTPVYFFKHMGGGMGKLYNDMLYNGQKTYSQDINESRQFMTAIFEKYHVWDWTSLNRKNKNDRLKFKTERGIKLDMSRNEVLTAYATYKRGEANGDGGVHMLEGGIIVKSKATESFFKTFNESRKGIPLTVNDIQEMFKFLTEEQKACADAIVQYLTVTDGEKRNETSMRLYGYKKFNETYYFPYRVASDYTKSRAGEEIKPEGGSASGGSKMLKNMGSSKALTPNANAAIVIDDFFKVAAESMNETARYHAFAVQQDNFMRVLNYKDVVDAEHGSTSVKQAIHDSYGNEGLNYITGFLGDIVNGAVQQNNDDIFGRLFGKFKKTAVAANLSVAIQQPSAIMRATALIDEKYLIKTVGQKNRLDEMFDYSSTAFLKQMGRFDVGTGRSAEEYILKPELRGKKYLKQLFATGEYSTGEFDDLTGYLSEKADWVTWGHLMNAVMAEIEDTTELVRGTEEFKEAVGRRFDEIVNATQVYDSILTKSPIMRSKNAFAQLSSAFMTEPTLSYNMVLDGFRARKTNPKYLGRTVKAYFLSVVANALLKSIIGAMRDRDEDDTYFEKYAEKLTENIMSDLVPIFNLPYASQIKDILQGGTVENQAYGMFSDTVSAIKKSFKKAESGDYFGALSEFTPVFNLFGLPVRNIVRDITAVFSTAFNSKPLSDTTLEGIFDAAGEGVLGALGLGNKSKTAEIKEAMKSGKPTNIRKATNELIEKYIASGKSESSAKGYIKASLTNYWKPIYINAGSEKQAKIRKALYNTGLYKNADEINKMCKKWLEDK